jgi:hypothetical protein
MTPDTDPPIPPLPETPAVRVAPTTPPKTPFEEGRRLLTEAGLRQGPSAGSRGELWLDGRGNPFFVAYAPPYPQFFWTYSLMNAIRGVAH